MKHALNRREILASLAMIVNSLALNFVPLAWAKNQQIAATSSAVRSLLEASLAGLPHLVGRLYLNLDESEKDIESLSFQILEALERTRTTPDTMARVTAAIRHDYRANQTVKLNGWVISLTEARLCAAYALQLSPEEG
jgi:hypothetical protein